MSTATLFRMAVRAVSLARKLEQEDAEEFDLSQLLYGLDESRTLQDPESKIDSREADVRCIVSRLC
jgi:hypothetical protein